MLRSTFSTTTIASSTTMPIANTRPNSDRLLSEKPNRLIAKKGPLAQVGLALATSIGAWINLGLVTWFAARAGHMRADARLKQSAWKLGVAGVAMALVLWLVTAPVAALLDHRHGFRDLLTLAIVGALGAIVYGGIVLALSGREWLKAFRARRRR